MGLFLRLGDQPTRRHSSPKDHDREKRDYSNEGSAACSMLMGSVCGGGHHYSLPRVCDPSVPPLEVANKGTKSPMRSQLAGKGLPEGSPVRDRSHTGQSRTLPLA